MFSTDSYFGYIFKLLRRFVTHVNMCMRKNENILRTLFSVMSFPLFSKDTLVSLPTMQTYEFGSALIVVVMLSPGLAVALSNRIDTLKQK